MLKGFVPQAVLTTNSQHGRGISSSTHHDLLVAADAQEVEGHHVEHLLATGHDISTDRPAAVM